MTRWIVASLLLTLTVSSAMAFRIVKDINAKPPEEKVVYFDKSAKPQLTFTDNDNCKITINADGAIESRIVGSGEVNASIKWDKPFNAADYQYLLLTCRLEGSVKTTTAPGKVTESRPDNLWFGPSLLNTKGERVGGASLADVADDLKTPSQMVALKIPMVMFLGGPNDSSEITGLTFRWDKTRAGQDRDFRLVIEHIGFAN